jgi:hypothetical protein
MTAHAVETKNVMVDENDNHSHNHRTCSWHETDDRIFIVGPNEKKNHARNARSRHHLLHLQLHQKKK